MPSLHCPYPGKAPDGNGRDSNKVKGEVSRHRNKANGINNEDKAMGEKVSTWICCYFLRLKNLTFFSLPFCCRGERGGVNDVYKKGANTAMRSWKVGCRDFALGFHVQK